VIDKEIAEKSAECFAKADIGTHGMGITISGVDKGRASAEITITPEHMNGHGTGHGGVIYFLGIAAFGYAANTINRRGFGQQASITYLAPATEGDRLTATAQEVHSTGRSMIIDVEIRNQNDTLIATMRAMGHLMREPWFEPGG